MIVWLSHFYLGMNLRRATAGVHFSILCECSVNGSSPETHRFSRRPEWEQCSLEPHSGLFSLTVISHHHWTVDRTPQPMRDQVCLIWFLKGPHCFLHWVSCSTGHLCVKRGSEGHVVLTLVLGDLSNLIGDEWTQVCSTFITFLFLLMMLLL